MKTMNPLQISALFAGAFFCSTLMAAAPAGWKDRCFGAEQHAGSASYSTSGGVTNLTVEGGGTDIWGVNDFGRYVFTPFAGDCEIIATIPYIPTNTTEYGEWLRVGVMMRGSTMHGGQNVSAFRVKGTAGSGNRNKLQKRLAIRGESFDFDTVNATLYATDRGVRMRLRRQGDTFTVWCSTNAPAYNYWELVGTENDVNGELPSALNLGVCVSRWQDLGPDTYTATFSDVVARNLVRAKGYGSGITVQWITDTPVQSGSVVGYTVNRAPVSSGTFTEVADLGPAAFVYSDATAGSGTSYVYRVYARVENGAVTNDVLVGDSLQLRKSDSANPSPAPVKGVAGEYFDTNSDYNTLVGARVDPYVDNSWNLGGTSVYPDGTGTGLANLDTFRARWNGSVVVDESGCYEMVTFVDDIANIYINGERLIYTDNYQSGNWIYTAPFYLEAGRSYTFQCDVQENSGGEALRINWFKADGTASESRMPQAVFEPFPRPWLHRDIGNTPFFGNAVFDESDLSFSLSAGAGDIDNQHLIWRQSAVDFDLLASAELTNADQSGVNAGVTVRSSTETGAQAVSVALVSTDGSGGREIALTIRDTDGGAVNESAITIAGSIADLRLSRRGDTLLACYRTASSGGWVIATNLAINLPDTVYAGMQSYTATDTLLATNTFSAVTFAENVLAALNVSVANLEADISTPGNPLAIEQDKANLPNVAWYWHSDSSDIVDGNYTVYKATHWDNGYTQLATLNAGNSYTYTDTLAASNTVYFYRMYYTNDFGAFADGRVYDISFTSARVGVSDGSINAGGTGLYNAYYRGYGDGFFPTNTPAHAQIRGLNSWEKGTANTPMVTAANSDDGQAIGPDRFISTWSGYIVPPYTGYYSLRTDTDDAIVLYLDGRRMIEVYAYAQVRTAADVYLEAGVPVPVFYYFQQGTGGGYFRAYWKTGVGTNAEYVGIPASALIPLGPEDMPLFVNPTGPATFGNWKNMDIGGPSYPGHAVMGGTPEAFDAEIFGSGADIWGTADQFHYLFQETAEDFELEGTINALITDFEWAKVGLMLRESTAPGSRHVHILQSYSQGRRLQYRASTNGTSAGYDGAAKTMMNQGGGSLYLPTNFKIVRKGRKVTFFLNDQPVPLNDTNTFVYDISSWGSNSILAGLSITSHENNKLVPAVFNDVSFTILHDPGTVMILK